MLRFFETRLDLPFPIHVIQTNNFQRQFSMRNFEPAKILHNIKAVENPFRALDK